MGSCMRDPKRILSKLLGKNTNLEPFESTGEPLGLLVEILRDVVGCRKTRDWLWESYGIDLAVSPASFDQLLDIPQINFIETPNRKLEMEVVSLKDTREAGDPVSVGNLNGVLRELYRTLNAIGEKERKEYPDLILKSAMSAGLLDTAARHAAALRTPDRGLAGFLRAGWKARTIEKEFRAAFPGSPRAHPLRKSLTQIERELEFYRECLQANDKWRGIGLDVFRILRVDGLPLVLENIEKMGNLLWNIVYNHPTVRRSLALTGIDFADVRPLFDSDRVPVNNV